MKISSENENIELLEMKNREIFCSQEEEDNSRKPSKTIWRLAIKKWLKYEKMKEENGEKRMVEKRKKCHPSRRNGERRKLIVKESMLKKGERENSAKKENIVGAIEEKYRSEEETSAAWK